MANVDEELVRSQRSSRNIPTIQASSVDGVDIPIQLILSPEGEILFSRSEGHPFSSSTLDELATLNGFHTIGDENYRVLADRVVDHGPGVAPEDEKRLFLPFYRADSSRSSDGRSGAGLGLALAKQITDQHQGTIGIEPTPGSGSTFILTFPVCVSPDSVVSIT